MVRVVVRRLLQLVPVLLGLSVVVFVWVRALPGDPSASLLAGDQARGDTGLSREAVGELRRLYGLERPMHEQYLSWMKRVASLDLGQSIATRQEVTAEIGRRFPATVELALAALVVAVGLGVPLGFLAARRAHGWFDHLSMGAAVATVSVPVFFFAFLLKYVFAVRLGWLPSVGRLDVTREVPHPTGLYLLDAVLTLDRVTLVDAARHLVMPALSLAVVPMAYVARITRGAVLEVSQADYVRTALAKGAGAWRVDSRHVLRNALPPVATVVGLTAGFLLSGAVLVEVVFAWGGMGTLLFQAIDTRDYPVLQGGILFLAVVFVVVNLLVDVAHAVLDPRVRVT